MSRRQKKIEPVPFHGCDAPGCKEGAPYRAPKGRDRLNEYYWFCLDHVRNYNKSWDYYAGMDPEQIEAEIRRDIVGQRPSWPLGLRKPRWRQLFERKLGGGFIPEDVDEQLARHFGAKPKKPVSKNDPEKEALAILGLKAPASFAEVRKAYKILVKRYHPDANGGDKEAEERLKTINNAYNILKAAALRDEAGLG